ncbi:hypothetical protein B7494_g6198 [Chlorociboria aeruginascens]|nr:hypothetical protein B7494_g6198 [Chlorociboria aeruginascens]
MSLIETERLLRSCANAKHESTDFAVFFYNYKCSEAEFKALFKSAQYRGMAWLPGWTWHINQNAINRKIPPAAIPTDRRIPARLRKPPPSKSIGTYGYVITISAADQSRLSELYGLSYIKTVGKVTCTANNDLSPKQTLSAIVHFDPWNTADFGKSMLNKAWQRGLHNLRKHAQRRITSAQSNGLGSGSHNEVATVPGYHGQRNPQLPLSERQARPRGVLEASNIPGKFINPQQFQATGAINDSRRAIDAQKENTKMPKPSLHRFPSIHQRNQPPSLSHPQQVPSRAIQEQLVHSRARPVTVIPGKRRSLIGLGAAAPGSISTKQSTIYQETRPIMPPANGMARPATHQKHPAVVTQLNQVLNGLTQSELLLRKQGQVGGRIVTPPKQSVNASNIVSSTMPGGPQVRMMQPTDFRTSQQSQTRESGYMLPPATPSRRHSIGQPSSSHSQASTVSEGSSTPSKRVKFVRKSGTRAEAEKNGKLTPRKMISDMKPNPQRRIVKDYKYDLGLRSGTPRISLSSTERPSLIKISSYNSTGRLSIDDTRE